MRALREPQKLAQYFPCAKRTTNPTCWAGQGVLADRVLHLLYTMAITPGHPEAMTKAREGLRSALGCYNKALGDDRARACPPPLSAG